MNHRDDRGTEWDKDGPPNPRGKQRDDTPKWDAGSFVGKVGLYVVVALTAILLAKANNIVLLSKKSPDQPAIQPVDRPAPVKVLVNAPILPDVSDLQRSISEWDKALNETSTRIAQYREPLGQLEMEMRVTQQSMDRLQSIGDVKGRNELVYQYNEKNHRRNNLVAEQTQLVAHHRVLVNGRNQLVNELNSLLSKGR